MKEGETGVGEGRIGYACDVYMGVYYLRSTIFLGGFTRTVIILPFLRVGVLMNSLQSCEK